MGTYLMHEQDEDTEDCTRTFLASWDTLGFECVIDITKIERENLIAVLSGKNPTNLDTMLRNIILRARFNPQRFPQVWIFKSNVDQKTLWAAASESPQATADLIRKHGTKVYGDPVTKPVII